MLKPDYYPLSTAAEIINSSEENLIHFAAKGLIDIAILVGNCITLKQVINNQTGLIIDEQIGAFPGHQVKLSPFCLKDFEANIKDAKAICAIYIGEPNGNTEIIYILDERTKRPLLLKDCKLIMFANEAERLIENKPNQADSFCEDWPEDDTKTNDDQTSEASLFLNYLEKKFNELRIPNERMKPLDFLKSLKEFINPIEYPTYYDREEAPISSITCTTYSKKLFYCYDSEKPPKQYKYRTLQNRVSEWNTGWVPPKKKGKASNNNKK